jgi:MATE family multidrug resistance protein
MYGKFGCVALGFEGAAWATLASRSAILLAMLMWMTRDKSLSKWVPSRWLGGYDFKEFRRLLSIGIPASAQMVFEVSAFSVVGLWMGFFGADAMAAHQIAITMAGLAFMIPLGFSMALTVRMGEAQGAGEIDRLRPIALSGWLLILVYAVLGGSVFLIFGNWIASCFTDSPAVIHLAASLLVIVGVFQFVDGMQVASASMLRGLHDTRVPALIALISYWCIGLPVSAGLAFWLQPGPRGIWWGLAAGLFVACVTLVPRLWRQIQRAA